MTLVARARTISFPRRPLLMGIVNVNDDSFCGDGTLDPDLALAQAQRLIGEGADIIDVGAESARTNRAAISIDEEIARLEPFLAAFPKVALAGAPADSRQLWPPLLSLNTWRPEVAAATLPLGVEILNDIGALANGVNAELCGQHGAALVIMHSVGLPKEPHAAQTYEDLWAELVRFFDQKIALAKQAGLEEERLILDPGIDFAKRPEANLAIYREFHRLAERFPRPWLLPISRKTIIGHVLGQKDPNRRDAGTVACLVAGVARGASVFRVHNVKAMRQALRTIWSVLEE